MRLVYDQVQIAGLPADGAVAVFDRDGAGARTSKRTAPQWQPPRCVTSGGAASKRWRRAGDEGDEQRRAPVAAEAAVRLEVQVAMTSSRPPIHISRDPPCSRSAGQEWRPKRTQARQRAAENHVQIPPTTCRIMNDRGRKISRRLLATLWK